MRVMVTFEARLLKTKNGNVYSRGASIDLEGYLSVFDEVVVFARMEEVAQEKLDKFRIDGENIRFFPLSYYVGPWQFLRQYRRLNNLVKLALQEADAFILRVPGSVATLLWHQLKRKNIPYAVEVVGDPWDSLAPGGVKTIARPLFRRILSRQLARQCHYASVASYVTEYALQKRYPAGGWTTHYSSVELSDDAIIDEVSLQKRIERLKAKSKSKGPWRICYVGTIAQLYKAPDVLIKACASCINRGINLELIMVGGGRFRPQLEQLAKKLGITKWVHFTGILSKEKVFGELDKADLYVLPSRTEGLPRSVIEAIARGLPCIGSTVGGFPELLDTEDLVPPGDPKALVEKISSIIVDKSRLEKMARRNLSSAHKYRKDKLDQRRKFAYEKLVEITKSKTLPE
jgi:glycosyltransferase involved in cell wall biosynthesis